MTIRQQWMVVGGVVLVLGVVLGALTIGLRDEVFPVGIGSRAPQFRARKVQDGTPTTLSSYKGHVVLLNVWATWCEPCRAEMPDIERLYRAYGPSGLNVVAVSVDTGIGDSVVTQFAHGLGLTFDVLRDSTGSIEHDYQTTAVPESFVIDDMGVIRKKEIGAYGWNAQESRALISHLLGLGTPISVSDSG
jgi:cytochrome c biogenesis protein CcmG, thiol:disulfide interchange protein DsbE